MVTEKYSWTIISTEVAIKHTDLSFFKNHGSGIPIEFRYFFNIDSLEPGNTVPITISFKGREYRGRLSRSRSTTRVTRIFWNTDLSTEFNRMFPAVIKTKDYPDVSIIKESDTRYRMEFVEYYSEGQFELDTFADNLENEVVVTTKEGKKKQYYSTHYERSQKNRLEAIKRHGTICMACGFDFEKIYGERGRNFIEVHHLIPLSSRNQEVEVNPETDLVCICSNCHRMIHRSKDKVLTLEELKSIIHDRHQLQPD